MAETCRERLRREYPERCGPQFVAQCDGCPRQYGYLSVPEYCYCNEDTCTRCWNREIPESIEKKLTAIPEVKPDETDLQMIKEIEKEKNMSTNTTKKTKAQLLEEIDGLKTELKRLEKYAKYDDTAEEMKAFHDSFVRAGFTEGQAFAIMTTVIQNANKF